MKNKPSKARFILIDCVLYPYEIFVCVEATQEEVLMKIKKNTLFKLDEEIKKLLELEYDVSGRHISIEGTRTHIILLRYPLTTSKGIATLSHEVFHTVYSIMSTVGIPLTEESEEAYAYLITYVTNEIMESVKLK